MVKLNYFLYSKIFNLKMKNDINNNNIKWDLLKNKINQTN